MPKKVLIFESDAAFAAELRTGLAQFGSEALVVDDANVGLQSAASSRPDLILLSIELPRTNGFSVCNRIKRDPSLKDVPLVILSSDSTEETFEQHRRLRTRAEDYVHKPIPFGSLLERIQQLVPFDEALAGPPQEGDAGLVMDEALVLDEGAPMPEAELNQLADRAFEALLESSPGPPNTAGVTPPTRSLPSTPPGPRASVPPAALPSTPPLSSADAQELLSLRQRVSESERTLGMAQRRVAELELGAARAADQSEELERMRRELEEARRRLEAPSAGKGAGSGREILELREALNRKDKELLDLRDQLSRKDKELLCLRETNLGIERQYADLSDRILEFEKQAFELGKAADALKADKEQADKRAEDQKRKVDRLTEDFEAKTKEILSLRDVHEAEKVALKEEHQRLLAKSLAEAREAAEQVKLRALELAAEEAKAVRDRALADREAELRREFDGRVGLLLRSHEDALAKLKAELGQTLEEAEMARRKLESELGERVRAYEAARRNVEEYVRSIAGLETDLGERTAERDTAWKAVEERERRIASLQGELQVVRSETDGVRRDLGREKERWERARAKWAEDRSSLERAKDALAVALARIEEPEGRALD